MKAYRLYILDLDGTIYRGAEAVPNALEAVRELGHRGALIRYLTNNSALTRASYAEKLTSLGFDVHPNQIYTSAIGALRWCRLEGYSKVFFVGEPGLRQTLEAGGMEILNENGGKADVVVAGICRGITYGWLSGAMRQILGGARFLATNTDATYPIEGGMVEPGAGAIVAAIQTATGMGPEVVGKPNPFLIKMILNDAHIESGDALAVGDRYETDVLSGRNAGLDSHLVLTGVTRIAPPGQSWSHDLRGLL